MKKSIVFGSGVVAGVFGFPAAIVFVPPVRKAIFKATSKTVYRGIIHKAQSSNKFREDLLMVRVAIGDILSKNPLIEDTEK